MKFLAYGDGGRAGLAIQSDDGTWQGLTEDASTYPGDLDSIVRAGSFGPAAEALRSGAEIHPDNIAHAIPFRRADKVLCVGLNYADHATESKMEAPDFPTVFVRFNSNLIAHGDELVAPAASSQFDYEGEVVAVIGTGGRDIAKADALDHVAGYTIFNDGSVRDFQLRTNQWTIGKNFDGTGAMGPIFVTADDLPDGAAGLKLQTRLNGEVLQDATTSDLLFTVADLVSMLSVGMRLEPGDLIVTGTPSGVGMARDPQVWMKPGDVCEVEVEGIGILRNPVRAEVRE